MSPWKSINEHYIRLLPNNRLDGLTSGLAGTTASEAGKGIDQLDPTFSNSDC